MLYDRPRELFTDESLVCQKLKFSSGDSDGEALETYFSNRVLTLFLDHNFIVCICITCTMLCT